MTKYLAIYGKPRYLGIIETDKELEKALTVVVESHRGEEYAVVAGELSEAQEVSYRKMRNTAEHGDGGLKNGGEALVSDLKYILTPSEDEIEAAKDYVQEELDILLDAKDILEEHKLEMKLIDVEFIRKRRKLFFYFSSEQRVDFRAYVRDLAREFKTRIELRQIGVRDEAKIIRGVAPCGNPCCCSYWLNQFAPINIRMVKEQNLALNPAKISGICGRLMCCMHYEQNVYHEIWRNLPNPGSKLKTPNGNIIVAGIDLRSNSVRCFIPGRGEVKVPVDDFPTFKETVMSGKEWIVEDPAKVAYEAISINVALEESAAKEDGAIHAMTGERPPSTDTQEKTGRRRRKKRSRGGAKQGEESGAPQVEKTESADTAEKGMQEDQAAGDGEGATQRRSRRGRHRRGGRGRKKPQETQE